MRRSRIIAGAAAIMVMACSAMPSFTFAAGEKVAISANKVTAEAGGTFEIEVSLSDIPSTGIGYFEQEEANYFESEAGNCKHFVNFSVYSSGFV